MSYIKIIYIFLYFPFSLIQKKGKAPGASQANRPSQRHAQPTSGPGAGHLRPSRPAPAPDARTPSPSVARSLPSLSPSLTRGARPLSFPSPTLCRARARSPPPRPSSTGSRSRDAPLPKLMPYINPAPSSLDPPKTLSSTPPVARALAERISPPPPRFAATPDAGEHPLPLQASSPEPQLLDAPP